MQPHEEGRGIQTAGIVLSLGLHHTDTTEELLLLYRTSANISQSAVEVSAGVDSKRMTCQPLHMVLDLFWKEIQTPREGGSCCIRPSVWLRLPTKSQASRETYLPS